MSLVKLFNGFQSKLALYVRIASSCQTSFLSTNSLDLNNAQHQVKRPPSPFAYFFQEKSTSLKEQNPEMKQKDIMRLASAMWKNCTSYEQQQYREMFDKRMQEYKQMVKEPPKRPATAYIQFFSEQSDLLRYQYPNVIDRSRKVAEMWRGLSEHEKEHYKNAYTKQLNQFLENLTEEDKQVIQERKDYLSMRRERQNIRRYGKEAWKERPKVPGTNAYIEFIRDNMSSVPKDQNSFVFLSQTWKKLSEDEKVKYKEMAEKIAEQQQGEIAEWQEKHNIN